MITLMVMMLKWVRQRDEAYAIECPGRIILQALVNQYQQQTINSKKAKSNSSLISKENIIHQDTLDIHDFQGHMSLNGGIYKMPFSI